MTKLLHILFAGVLSFVVLPGHGHAQFIDLRLNIDARLSAQTERAISFGTVTSNSGQRFVSWGSPDMGVFSVTALENQTLLLTLDTPEELNHENPAISDIVPLSLQARYGYSIQNFGTAVPMSGTSSFIRIEENPNPSPWNTLYLFIYGSITIGEIPPGIYSNDIVLNVEYL